MNRRPRDISLVQTTPSVCAVNLALLLTFDSPTRSLVEDGSVCFSSRTFVNDGGQNTCDSME